MTNTSNAEPTWRARFRARRILWTEIARLARTRGVVASNMTGVCQLYSWDVPTGKLVQTTHVPEGVYRGTISADGSYVYYLEGKNGAETGHLVAVPFEGGSAVNLTPDLPAYSSVFWSAPDTGAVGLTVAYSGGFELWSINQKAKGFPRRLIYRSRNLASGPYSSQGGKISLVASTDRSERPEFNLIAFDTLTSERIRELWDGPGTSIEPFYWAFSPVAGDLRVLATTNRTGPKRPLIWNTWTGDRVDLQFEELEGEVVPCDWSTDAKRILLCQFCRAVQQLYVYDIASNGLKRLLHPSGTFGSEGSNGGNTYFGPRGSIFSDWDDSTHSTQLIELDNQSGQLKCTILAADSVPPGHPWTAVTFASSDGEMIQGWLGVPDGEGPFPTILHTHGGPEEVRTNTFDARAQAWLDSGFAYLTINYRGSTTFGRDFAQRIWGNPGHWEVEDMVAAHDWLIEKGIARSDRILLNGWSYGGYLTLLAIGKRPDLWCGGMAGVAIADWRSMYEDTSGDLRGWIRSLFGGGPNDRPDQYRASSPIAYVERVAAPVLIIQGRNDTRCPPRQVEEYAQKMRALGKPIEVHWFETGHLSPFMQVDEGIKNQEIMLSFARHLIES